MTVVNKGAAASFARVFIDVQSDYNDGGGEMLKVAAGERRTLRVMFAWPDEEGAAISAGIELRDPTPYHRVNERGDLELTRGEDLTTPYDLLDWKDDANSPKTIVAARAAAAARPTAIDVPVDTSVSRLVVSVESVAGVTTTFVRPGGGVVREGEGDVRVSQRRLST